MSWLTLSRSWNRYKHPKLQERGEEPIPERQKQGDKTTQNEEDTIQIVAQASPSFQITTYMLQVDEAIAQMPLKYLAQVQLVLAKIPTKALYKLQVSVTQEVQSRAREDMTELQVTRDGKDALEIVVEQVKLETQEEKQVHR
jgi:hypothetical protein